MKDSDKIEERLRSSAEYLIDLMGNNVDEHMQEAVEAMLAAAYEIRSYKNVAVGPAESLQKILAGMTSYRPKKGNANFESELRAETCQYALEEVSVSDDFADSTAYASLSSGYGVDEANGTIYRTDARDGVEIRGRTI